jgi:type IV secretory pathway TraG/TraD family ATPase VirD4
MAEARKYGGCFGLGFQSFPQLEELYGRAAASQMSDLLNTRFFFRSPAAPVARLVQGELGEFVRMKCSEHTSFGSEQVRDGISFARQEERHPLVSFTDIQTLPDLSCYVTLPGDWPVVRMNLKYQPLPVIADEFLERPVSDSLDATIEDAIAHSEKEAKNLQGLFDDESSAENNTTTEGSHDIFHTIKNILDDDVMVAADKKWDDMAEIANTPEQQQQLERSIVSQKTL